MGQKPSAIWVKSKSALTSCAPCLGGRLMCLCGACLGAWRACLGWRFLALSAAMTAPIALWMVVVFARTPNPVTSGWTTSS